MNHSTKEGVKVDGSPCTETTAQEEGSVRERILAVARTLFVEKGFSATSVREIADGVGVTVPALYYHYGSKRGMLLALVERHCAAVTGAVSIALERTGDPGEHGAAAEPGIAAALVAGLQAYVGTLSTLTGASTLALRDPSLYVDVEIRGLIAAAERSMVTGLTDLLREGIASGELRPVDPVKTAPLLLAAARGVHVSHGLWGGTADGWELGRSLAELMLDGLRA
ncbi:MAG: TetR/AcrR family transcriptional regulator [Thermoleophilia bacterium]